jgi:hypothetical protein
MASRETKKRNVSTPGRKGERTTQKTTRPDDNPDPITGAPGSHPIGVGAGAAAGGAVGAAVGSVIPGPGSLIGAAIGVVVGALGGGAAGKAIGEAIDPTAEDAYWRENLQDRPYYDKDYTFDRDYAPAYGFGYAMRHQFPDRTFDSCETDLAREWDRARGKSRLDWERARPAVQDAYTRYDVVKRERAKDEARRHPGM